MTVDQNYLEQGTEKVNFPRRREITRVDGGDYSSFTSKQIYTLNRFADKGRNSNWRSDIINNRNATTALTGYKQTMTEVSRAVAEARVKVKPSSPSAAYKQFSWGMIQPDGPPGAAATEDPSVDNDAKRRFSKKLVETQRQFSTGVFLGELPETLHMLKNGGLGVWNALNKGWKRIVKKQSTNHGRRRPRYRDRVGSITDRTNRDLANAWLGWNLGVTPFVRDVQDASRAINRLSEFELGIVPLYAWSSSEKEIAKPAYTLEPDYMVTWRETVTKRSITYVRYTGATRAMWDSPARASANLFGADLRDFVPTVWELIPYSFLVDYFTNIGDILQSWSYGRVGLAWSSKLLRRQYVITKTVQAGPASSTYEIVHTTPGEVVSIRTDVDRSAYGGDFVPSFSWQLPGFAKQWFNTGALLDLKLMSYLFKK